MVALLTDYFRTHRIVASRAFAVMGLCVLLVTESAWDSTWLELGTFLAGVVLVGIATVGRLWCSVYISGYKTTKLITVGPYSITRNPLYFFSALGFVGVALVSEALILPMLVVALLMVFTPSVIEQEERVLAAKFGEEFSTYCRRTPRFWPRLSV